MFELMFGLVQVLLPCSIRVHLPNQFAKNMATPNARCMNSLHACASFDTFQRPLKDLGYALRGFSSDLACFDMWAESC